MELVLLALQLRDLVVDLPVQLGGRELDRPADGVLDRMGVRAAVADEAAAVDPEEGGGAVLAVVDPGAEAVEGGLGEQVARLRAGAPLELLSEHLADQLRQRLGAL